MIKLTPFLGVLMSMCWTLPAFANCGNNPHEFLSFVEGLHARVKAGEFNYISLDDGTRCPPLLYNSSATKVGLYWHADPDGENIDILYITTGRGPCGFTLRTPVSEVTSVTFGLLSGGESSLSCGVIQGTIRLDDNTIDDSDEPFED